MKQKKNTGEIHTRARTFHHEHLHAFFDRVVRLSRAHLVLLDAKRCHARHRLFSLKFGVCALIMRALLEREKARVFVFRFEYFLFTFFIFPPTQDTRNHIKPTKKKKKKIYTHLLLLYKSWHLHRPPRLHPRRRRRKRTHPFHLPLTTNHRSR